MNAIPCGGGGKATFVAMTRGAMALVWQLTGGWGECCDYDRAACRDRVAVGHEMSMPPETLRPSRNARRSR